jgi:hypothetical protein
MMQTYIADRCCVALYAVEAHAANMRWRAQYAGYKNTDQLITFPFVEAAAVRHAAKGNAQPIASIVSDVTSTTACNAPVA